MNRPARSGPGLSADFDASMRADPRLNPSDWADGHRVLSSVESGEPGRWRTDRTPYLREILDKLSAQDPTERVVVMKGAQVGGTEVSLNWIGYCIACSPGPMLAVQPTVEMGKRWSKGRLAPMIGSTPALSQLVAPPRERDSGNTLSVKEFPGGVLVITGANSAVGLRSMPVQRLILDEVDGYPGDADDEGDPVDLAVKRTSTFASRRKILMISTPTIKGQSRIERAFNDSDQRRFHVPCLRCGAFHVIKWEDIRWPEGEPRKAQWRCPSCGSEAGNHEKTAMLARGEWRPTAPGDGKTAGYHLPSLLAPHGWDSWGDIAAEFVEAGGDPTHLQVWVNTRLGETWEDRSGAHDPADLIARATEHWSEDALPAAILRITVGGDTQDDRLEAEVVGWGAAHESWSLGYHRIEIPPYDPEAWADFDALLRKRFRTVDGRTLRVEAACIDAGGHMSAEVFAFTRARRRRHVWATFGRGGDRAIWTPKAGVSQKHRAQYHVVGVDKAKLDVYARLGIGDPGPGYCHFPAGRDADYFAGLTCERKERVVGKDGHTKIRWVKGKDERNEPLDCRVLAYAAILGLTQMVGRRLGRLPGAPVPASSDASAGPRVEPAFRAGDPEFREAAPRDSREFAPDEHWGGGQDDGW